MKVPNLRLVFFYALKKAKHALSPIPNIKAIAKALKKEPGLKQHIKAMYEQLQEKAKTDKSINIVNSKTVVTGRIKAGGNIIVGHNNNTNASK